MALLGAGLALADAKPAMKRLAAGRFTLTATQITSFGRGGLSAETGKLKWRGGLQLVSSHKNFGGWSGLVIEPDGRRFLSVSDAGAWMTGEITYENEAPSGIAHPRIGRYDFSSAAGVSSPRGFLELPETARRMTRNGGFEAMTVLKGGPHAGEVVAFSERLTDLRNNHEGWLWATKGERTLKLKDKGGYDISDVASLEDGSLIVLERRFRWLEGLYIRLRMVPVMEVGKSEPIEGETLLEADLSQEIDNMEGLAISRDANGTAVLTLISDDNFNRTLQRTLLLQFAYPDDPAKSVGRAVTAKARP